MFMLIPRSVARSVLALALLIGVSHAAEPPCTPLEQRSPNAASQRPADSGQTRACAVSTASPFDVTVIARGLDRPWAVEPLPDGGFLVTEKPGRMRVIGADGARGEPLAGLPPVDAAGQGGLLDVALDPDFAANRIVYWTYAEPRDDGNGTSLACGVLARDHRALTDVRVLFRAQPTYDGDKHFGSRLLFDDAGHLYLTLGERSDRAMRAQAQQLDSHMGKVLRLTRDGAPAPDNPFADEPGALPEIWTLGHRNVQALARDATGTLWVVEHGTRGGDELNRLQAGANYGWPRVAYGEEYIGLPIAGAKTERTGYTQPVYYWDPVIGPSGAQFHSGRGIAEWRGNLFVGGLKDGVLVRLVLEDGRVTGEEHLLADRGERVRDVREGPDGALYVVTDDRDGALLRVGPPR